MKKLIIALIATIVVAGVAIVFFYRNITHKQTPPYREVIDDSLRIIRDNIKINHDSGAFWNAQHRAYLAKKDSVERLDSARIARLRDSLGAVVRANVAARLRKGTARQPDPL